MSMRAIALLIVFCLLFGVGHVILAFIGLAVVAG
jgi:hypothetical protein